MTACDKLDNARAILTEYLQRGEAIWPQFRGGRDGVLWYYRTAVEILRRDGAGPLVAELDRVVSEIERVVAGGSDAARAAKKSS